MGREIGNMSTTRITIDPDDPGSWPEGSVDYAVLDATTEEDIASQQREDDAEAMTDCPRCAHLYKYGNHLTPGFAEVSASGCGPHLLPG